MWVNAYGASTYAARQGLISAGADDNSFLIFSSLMDSKSLFLTANADTVYFIGNVDLTKGPMVLETPPMAFGTIAAQKGLTLTDTVLMNALVFAGAGDR